MKKTFACAFVLFMFASTTTALAGDKRFCGWVALDGGELGNTNIAAGSWFDKKFSTTYPPTGFVALLQLV